MGPTTPDSMRELLLQHSPELDPAQADALAKVWSELVNRIIKRMFAISDAEFGSVLHADVRPDAIYELARLMVFLERMVVEHRAKAMPLESYVAVREAERLESLEEATVIENTARNLFEGGWKIFMQRWRNYRPLIEPPPVKNPPRRVRRTAEPHRSAMHFVPQFTTRPWADKTTGKFAVHEIGVDGEVRTRLGTARTWGAVDYLYSQHLEAKLGLIESDARKPYDKLARGIPLNPLDRSFWVAFLIAQIVRTPREMSRMMAGLKAIIGERRIDYPTTPAALARAFESLFEQNEIYALFYRLIVGRTWRIAEAAPGTSFLKGDNPAAIVGVSRQGTWTLFYPLTPGKCFVAGPQAAPAESPVLIPRVELSPEDVARHNALFCWSADTSVIGLQGDNDEATLRVIKANLTTGVRRTDAVLPHWGFHGVSARLK